MPPLPNARHERFAQAIADGRTAGEAYLAAGYSCGPQKARGHGHRLRTREDVQARIADLLKTRERIAEKGVERAIEQTAITKSWVLEKLRQNAERALQEREGAVANRALELLGRSLGIFIERTEQGKPGDFSHLSDEELDARLTQHLKAHGLSDRHIRNFLLVTPRIPPDTDSDAKAA